MSELLPDVERAQLAFELDDRPATYIYVASELTWRLHTRLKGLVLGLLTGFAFVALQAMVNATYEGRSRPIVRAKAESASSTTPQWLQ